MPCLSASSQQLLLLCVKRVIISQAGFMTGLLRGLESQRTIIRDAINATKVIYQLRNQVLKEYDVLMKMRFVLDAVCTKQNHTSDGESEAGKMVYRLKQFIGRNRWLANLLFKKKNMVSLCSQGCPRTCWIDRMTSNLQQFSYPRLPHC